MLDTAKRQMTPEEFYAWQEGMDERYELVDGYPVPHCPDIEMTTGASRRHDQIVWNLFAALKSELRGKPCRGFTADTAVKTRTGRRRPDAGVECGPFDEDAYEAGEVRFLAEVLSPSTLARHQTAARRFVFGVELSAETDSGRGMSKGAICDHPSRPAS